MCVPFICFFFHVQNSNPFYTNLFRFSENGSTYNYCKIHKCFLKTKRPSTISSLLTVRLVISNAFLWFPTVWTRGFWSVVNLSLLWRFLLVAVYMVPPEDVSRDGAFSFPCDPSKGELPLPSVLVSVHKKTLRKGQAPSNHHLLS